MHIKKPIRICLECHSCQLFHIKRGGLDCYYCPACNPRANPNLFKGYFHTCSVCGDCQKSFEHCGICTLAMCEKCTYGSVCYNCELEYAELCEKCDYRTVLQAVKIGNDFYYHCTAHGDKLMCFICHLKHDVTCKQCHRAVCDKCCANDQVCDLCMDSNLIKQLI